MLQEWLKLSDAEWAVWTRAPLEGVLWAFGILAGVIVVGLALFAWGASRGRWKAVIVGLVLVVPAAMLTAVFLETAVRNRRADAWCRVEGRALSLGREACAAGGEATLIHAMADEDGFERTQYYWTAEGLCAARVTRQCRVIAEPVDRLPTPGMTAEHHGGESAD